MHIYTLLVATADAMDVDFQIETVNSIVALSGQVFLQEPKKMIRYLDSRVVSVKGEKFTEIKKPEDESMKNTYINLKPARQYRFH